MQVAGIGLAAGAVVVSVAALLQGAGAGKASPQPELLKLVTPTLVIGQEGAGTEKSADANAGAILSLRADVEHLKAAANELRARVFEAPEDAAMKALSAVPVEVAPGATFALLLEHIKQAGTPLPRMETLAPMGVDLETKLPATQGKGTVAGVIEMMNERLGPGEKIGVRLVEGGGVEIASQAYFDQKESMLVTYDLSPIVEARTSRGDRRAPSSIVEEAAHLVMSLVEPEQWRDNGGVLAEVSVFGEKLFIQAPRRLQPKIKWILDELVTSGGAEQASIEAKSGFPMLTSIPILNTPFTNSTPVREQVGDGPITIRACGEGRLEIIGAGGTMKATEIVIGGSEAKVEESGAH